MEDVGPSSGQHNAGDGDDEIAERDPEGSYCRYKEPVGKGRFKTVFKAFNRSVKRIGAGKGDGLLPPGCTLSDQG